MYDDLVADLVPYAWNGGIGTLFAYGQTGSGKTFTVSQLEELVTESLLENNLDGEREIYLTIIDLAGNSAFDLLQSRKPISVLEDSFGVTHLAGADEHHVKSKEEVRTLIEQAASFRLSAPTLRNDASSRSHGICRLRIKNTADNSEGILYLIDLAGSEAARDRSAHGLERMKEYKEINMSLSVLKDCIRGRVEVDVMSTEEKKRRRPRVPFRQSALTRILKHVFDPESGQACKTVVLACVNPSLADVSPSKNTLRYAETLRVLLPGVGETTDGPKPPMTWTNAELKDWISKNVRKRRDIGNNTASMLTVCVNSLERPQSHQSF